MKTRMVWLLTFLSTCALAGADEQVRRVQEELRKRNLYFGDIDGRKSPEIAGAVRRYQERKGFKATGEIDGDTLRSLNLEAPLKLAETWPEVAVLKSDAAREIAESDRKMLEELETIEVGNDDPPEPVGEPPPAEPTLAEKAEAFIREYLAACETNDLQAEMAFYADKMKYFDHGTVSRPFVERDVQRYYKRWPEREYELLDFKLSRVTKDELEVKFRISFRTKNERHAVTGRTLNTFKIRRDGGEFRLVALKEQRLRE